MTATEAQAILRKATNLPYAFQIEGGHVFAKEMDLDAVAAVFGEAKAVELAAAAIITDKGFAWAA